MALIQGIVDALEKDERFFAKVGDKATEDIQGFERSLAKLEKVHQLDACPKILSQDCYTSGNCCNTGGASLIIPCF